jgi:hypothetical protein
MNDSVSKGTTSGSKTKIEDPLERNPSKKSKDTTQSTGRLEDRNKSARSASSTRHVGTPAVEMGYSRQSSKKNKPHSTTVQLATGLLNTDVQAKQAMKSSVKKLASAKVG